MERCLRNLLVSLDGAEPTVNKGSLSELAQTFLTSEGSDHPAKLREKAGLLALLNLMGILEVFYAAGETAERPASDAAQDSQVSTGSSTQETVPAAPGGSPDSAEQHPVAEVLARLVNDKGSSRPPVQPHASPDTPGEMALRADALTPLLSAIPSLLCSKEGGIEPALLSAILKLVTSPSKTKPASTGKSSSPADEAQEATAGAGEASEDDAIKPSSQGSLGLDPNLIASLLNLLMGFDRARQKTSVRTADRPPPVAPVKSGEDFEITLSEDGKSVLARSTTQTMQQPPQQPPSLSQFLKQPSQAAKPPAKRPSHSHRPGVGIRRRWSKQRRSCSSNATGETLHGDKPVFARYR